MPCPHTECAHGIPETDDDDVQTMLLTLPAFTPITNTQSMPSSPLRGCGTLKEATNTSPCTDKTKAGLASSSSPLAPSSPHRSLLMSSVMDSPAAMAAASVLSGRKESMPLPDAAKITVAIRVRPLTEDEERVERVMSQGVVVDGTQVQVNGKDGRPQRTFAFDHCFDSTYAGSKTGSQEHLFETIGRKVLTDAWEGFNTCVFACTYTMPLSFLSPHPLLFVI